MGRARCGRGAGGVRARCGRDEGRGWLFLLMVSGAVAATAAAAAIAAAIWRLLRWRQRRRVWR